MGARSKPKPEGPAGKRFIERVRQAIVSEDGDSFGERLYPLFVEGRIEERAQVVGELSTMARRYRMLGQNEWAVALETAALEIGGN